MATKRYPDPALVTDSEAQGTMADRLSMSAVGSTPVVNPPPTLTPLADLAVNQSTSDIPVDTELDRDHLGRFSGQSASAWGQSGGYNFGTWGEAG